MTYNADQRLQAAAWKHATDRLPAKAKLPAPHMGGTGPLYDFCLPIEFAKLSLLEEVREPVLTLFAEKRIPWHQGKNGAPSNHLLSSQVQCANALGQMMTDPNRIKLAFGHVLDIADVVMLDDGRYLTFEFVPPKDYLGEAPRGHLTPGANCTSVDAAFRYRTRTGRIELALIEWKYVERYAGLHKPNETSDRTRMNRYKHLIDAPDGPVHADVMPFADVLSEPLYQLVRQQLLAHELETDPGFVGGRVHVLHVTPRANLAYEHARVVHEHPNLGSTVSEIWAKLLRATDRFIPLDSSVFLDPSITCPEYALRYGDQLV